MQHKDGHSVFFREYPCTSPSPCPTLLLLHGFPTSSYDYIQTAPSFTSTHNVLTYDQIGFGLSSKPKEGYRYNMENQARVMDWVVKERVRGDEVEGRVLDIVSHDMGNTVLTEYMRLRVNGMLDGGKHCKVNTVVFTNGGMVYDLISKRLGQMIITSSWGELFVTWCPKGLRDWFSRKQLRTIWGNNRERMEGDIENIMALTEYDGGDTIIDKLSYYLIERSGGEDHWVEAVGRMVEEEGAKAWWVWGDNDAVAPKEIPRNFSARVSERMTEG